ncbi:DUF2591 domain-containing protein [Serratia marcescens]|uniref:phage protein NinX family protein n=1 Tax=Serratia marcescens TaxID=615 RepID=UPI0011C8A42B|nr:phage protein NinX family protein [Serratia marcescens]TXE41410.1 DUF2591 domain-containing protein [Serratia marcescens]
MTDYSKMSDYEINTAVATSQFGNWRADADICKRITSKSIDYCNNPADAWPIIVENGISLYHDNGNWQAEMTYDAPVGAFGTDETCSKFVDDKKPLRAAMIVFLMMKDAEKC